MEEERGPGLDFSLCFVCGSYFQAILIPKFLNIYFPRPFDEVERTSTCRCGFSEGKCFRMFMSVSKAK